MIICKKCGYSGIYTGEPCPECGESFILTEDELNEQLSALKQAVKDKNYKEAVECYRILADEGYTAAEKEYAAILERGKLVVRNLDLAMAYYLRAARKNDAYAAYKYSRLATRENDVTAKFWLIYSAILGCTEAYPVVAEEFEECGYQADAHYFYSLAAACDDVDSIVTMAKRYYNGIGVEQSPSYAKWYMDKLGIPPIYAIKLAYKLRREAAKEPPDILPKNYDGLLHALKIQAKKSGFDTALLRLSEILAERGDIDSTVFVGSSLIAGALCKQNLAEGLKLLTRASALGSTKAYMELGDLYINGKYVEKNASLSIDYYSKAGSLGCAEGYDKVGDIYYTGEDIELDIAAAVKYYELAERAGSVTAREKADSIKRERDELYNKAHELERENPSEAFKLYTVASTMGQTSATYRLALCFEFGNGTEKNRHGAFIWYKKAAEGGEREAIFRLGLCYARGFGTKLDYKLAKETLIKAERCGVEDASPAILALMQKKAKKLSAKLYSSAMRLIYQKKFAPAKTRLEIAAELMHPKAIYTLGCIYEFGMGVPCDKQKGYSLYETAYSLFFRDPRAKYKLSVLRILKAK